MPGDDGKELGVETTGGGVRAQYNIEQYRPYDPANDYLIVYRVSSVVLVPPEEGLMIPSTYESPEAAARAALTMAGGHGRVWALTGGEFYALDGATGGAA